MTVDPLSLVASRSLAAIDDTAAMVRAVRERLGPLERHTAAIVAATRWSSPTAGAYHHRVEELQSDLRVCETYSDQILQSFVRLRALVELTTDAA